MYEKEIVCISTHFWHDFWFRKQHFMSRFAGEGYRILYVQPSHSVLRKYRKPELANNRLLFPRLERLDRRITLLSPPKLLPKPLEPISRKISCAYSSWLIGKALRKLGFEKSILWIYDPYYAKSLNAIPHTKLVFDLADDLSSYGLNHTRGSRFVAHCTTELALKSDLMIVTSPTLFDMYKDISKKCVTIPNGFDERLFNAQQKDFPNDMNHVSRPIAGFVGTLFSFLDYSLLYSTAKSLPNVSFVFIGPVEESGRAGVQMLNSLNNTYFFGPKKKELIPAYLSCFDICLNPFKVDKVSYSVSPLKVYEYLAMGKPVLSTPMPGLERESVGELIEFAHTAMFANRLKEILRSCNSEENTVAHFNTVQRYSWSSRFENLLFHIKDVQNIAFQ